MWHSPPSSHQSGLTDPGTDGEGQTFHQGQWGEHSPAQLGEDKGEQLPPKMFPPKDGKVPPSTIAAM